MTESFLWLVNHTGDTFSLGTAHRHFRQLVCTLEDVTTIKRVATSHWCAWAVGHDHRPYLYVFSSDVPIRIPETTFENQRWGPFHGFSKKSMLRSDRFAWSDETGTIERPKESVRLPSSHWDWDGDWMIDDNLRGEVVELGGWQYALDFPAVYSPEQHWNSFVRRRKWIHFRRFFATDCWANISDMEMVDNSECIIDISVGGFLLPSQPEGFLAVWAVMNSGNVYVRTNVHRNNPEGDAWCSISLGKHHGIINISVGATNIVWAVTWDGQGLVRTEVSRNNTSGSDWITVDSPDTSSQLMQVAVGRNAVWALSRDNKVWFRKGTWGDHTFWNKESAVGSLWVKMIGEMSQIALSSNDQVFAIDTAGQSVYFRTGVSSQDLTGKTWQRITLREDLSPFRDLGLLGDEELRGLHGSRRAPSETTSCSSVSLSTTASSSVNINDDYSNNSDVFLSPLSPSQSTDFSRMLSMNDHFPPAWSLGEEENEPDTPTETDLPVTQAAHSARQHESLSGGPVFPNPQIDKEFDAEFLNKEELHIPRVRSVSQYSLTDSLPLSSQTISPASSVGTVHLGFTKSASSQTDGVSTELNFAEGPTVQQIVQQDSTGDVDAIFQSSYPATVEKNQSATNKPEEQETNHICSNSLDIIQQIITDLSEDRAMKAREGVNTPDTDADNLYETESNLELTEVDRHFKTLAVNDVSNETRGQETQEINFLKSPDVALSNEKSTSLLNDTATVEDTEKESLELNMKLSSEEIKENQSQPVIEEESVVSKNDCSQDISTSVVSLSSTTDGEVVKKRSKSNRRSSSSRKSDPPGEPDSIVFKAPRKKKDNKRKSTDLDQAKTNDQEPVLSSATESPVLASQTGVQKDQEKSEISKDVLDESRKREEKSDKNVDYQSFPTTPNDLYESSAQFNLQNPASLTLKPLEEAVKSFTSNDSQNLPSVTNNLLINPVQSSLQNTSSLPLQTSEESVNSFTTSESIDPLQTDTDESVSSSMSSLLLKPVLRTNIKELKLHEESSKSPLQQESDNVAEPDLKQKTNVCDTNESKELNDNVKKISEIKLFETLEKVAQVKNEQFNPLVSGDKTNTPTKISVACQTEDLKFKFSLQRSPKANKSQKTKEATSTKWCSMTKLTPSLNKPVVAAASSFEKEEDTTKSYDSESDEIADFVTDLLSDDSETEDQQELRMEPQEQKIEHDPLDGENASNDVEYTGNDDKDEDKSCEDKGNNDFKELVTSDIQSCILTDLSCAEQSIRALSVSSVTSASSCAVRSRTMSGSVRNSPVLPSSLQLKQFSSYQQTPSPARLSSPSSSDIRHTPDSLAPLTMVAAQPRLCWRWLDATSCVIDDPNKVDWLSSKDEAGPESKVKISKRLREKLLRKIIARNKREATGFTSFETAVEKSTWVQKANMQMLQHGRQSRWVQCSVELEQGIAASGKGTLTVHYEYRRKQRHTQLQLSDMICVKMNTDPDLTTAFSVFTPDLNLSQQPLELRASSEKEAADWLDYLSSSKASAWNLNQPIPMSAIWSCSFTGDVLVSCDSQSNEKPYRRSWGLHGGHMALIETSPTGVTWGLGFDKMPHVYNGGYGGAVCTGQSHMSDNTQQMVDTHRVFVYENQKWFPVVGWCNKGVFHHNFHWVTSSGQFVTSRDQVKLPSSKWNWISDWTIDFSVSGGVDSSGWQYSKVYNGSFHRSSSLRDQYRRRRWVRRCRISLMGPWISAGSLGISDLSIQIDPVETPSDPIILWAVATNGDVLCRYGVTQSNPLGQSWVHIPRDQDKPFTSISVGRRGQVWGVATDGSAWYRTGVNSDNPAGKNWLQVVPPPPGSFRLRQVSAGALAVWAVDTGDNLWRRENITPTFPEGTGWEAIASKVKRVSVGPQDQVWIVADAYFQKSCHAPGVIYFRRGISDKHPGGTEWQRVIGSGWAHVSVRGLAANVGNADSGIEES